MLYYSLTRGKLLLRIMLKINKDWKKRKNLTNIWKKWPRKFKRGGEVQWSDVA